MSHVDVTIEGIAVSPGIGIGQACVLSTPDIDTGQGRMLSASVPAAGRHTARNVDAELARIEEAVTQAIADLQALRAQTEARLGANEAAIFDAHRMMLEDPEFRSAIDARIREEGAGAEAAVQNTADQYIALFDAIDDEYLKARAGDVRDIASRLLRLLTSGAQDTAVLPNQVTHPLFGQTILIAEELSPSDTVSLDPVNVAGIATVRGGATSHAAILAKSLGIPAIAGAADLLQQARFEDTVIIDGDAGIAILRPSPETTALYENRQEEQRRILRELESQKGQPSVTLDGCAIELFGNIGSPSDVQAVLENGGEGVGLFRTEFLFMERSRPPTEDEQYDAYRQVAEAFGEKPVTVRTLDAGGDKELPYLDLPTEDNPFLGLRAIRLCLAHPNLFETQIRAILRAGVHGNLRMMLPMINTVDEVRQAKAIIDKVKGDLKRDGVSFCADVPLGIMIETPAAALHADALAEEVEFFSIGTNDLIQYTLACDRGNPDTASLYTPYHPAVLSLISASIQSANRAGIPVGLCGEAASDEKLIPVFLAIGIDSLSMAAGFIPRTRAAIRRSRCEQPEGYIEALLQLPDAAAVEMYLEM
ncbi:MAG TPA: phosphoenolpyruvate--protein phosphotransferase [Clostridiales bacterium]|jgi:phosphotransferase system enzyme I (PtsI)|nr:phosphoenolpyruvate--protein phosphotransferase [Clostridiales bacterium]